MSSLSGNAQRMYNSGIGKTEYTSVLFGFKRQHRLLGAALFFLRLGGYWDIYCTCIHILSFITKPVIMRFLPILLTSTNSKQPAR